MSDAERMERFSAGEDLAVDPDAVERELASLWRAAGRTTDGRHPVTRACLWNVVVHAEEREGHEGFGAAEALRGALSQLPRHLASRALILKTEPEADGRPELESWISANCIPAGGGGKLVCSEEITFAARGDGERHLPGLVRALLVPGVPTAVVLAGTADPARTLHRQLGRLADRALLHADRSGLENPLEATGWLLGGTPLYGMDLGWLGREAIRHEVAAVFDPPKTEARLAALAQMTYVSPPSEMHTARMMLGWLASRLGATPEVVGPRRWSVARRRAAPVTLELTEDPDTEHPALTMSFGQRFEPVAIRCGAERIEVPEPGDGTCRVPRPHPPYEALIAQALASRRQDRAFERALAVGAGL